MVIAYQWSTTICKKVLVKQTKDILKLNAKKINLSEIQNDGFTEYFLKTFYESL